ncbi:hypothetical protein, partial [Micromonospora lupini]|uniref:hypothetical protein n=1 Tax=Micromonospora lupini TaxID=285679 RepID=UPI0033BFC872
MSVSSQVRSAAGRQPLVRTAAVVLVTDLRAGLWQRAGRPSPYREKAMLPRIAAAHPPSPV